MKQLRIVLSLSSWQAYSHSALASTKEWPVSRSPGAKLLVPLQKKGAPCFLARSLKATWLDPEKITFYVEWQVMWRAMLEPMSQSFEEGLVVVA